MTLEDASPLLIMGSVAAVGADWSPTVGFSEADQAYLFTLRHLAASTGLFFKKALSLIPVNMNRGWDFLTRTRPLAADVVLTCFVNDLRGSSASMQNLGPRNRASPRHHDPNAWRDAAWEAGARAIFCVSDALSCDEVTIDKFKSDLFVAGPTLRFKACLSHNMLPPTERSYILQSLLRTDVAALLPPEKLGATYRLEL